MTTEEQNERVSRQLEQYTKRPLMKSAEGKPLLLVTDDHNANAIVQEMQRLFPDQAMTLQRCLDLIRSEFSKQLHWVVDPSWKPASAPEPPAPPQPQAKKDARSREQKLRDAGVFVRTDKATPEDMKADEDRHKAAREKLKALFTDDPKRVEFDDALKAANALIVTTGPSTISRVKSFEARERAREELRKKWPQYASLAVQPESEKINHHPGVF